jgi:hypothetical protein
VLLEMMGEMPEGVGRKPTQEDGGAAEQGGDDVAQ